MKKEDKETASASLVRSERSERSAKLADATPIETAKRKKRNLTESYKAEVIAKLDSLSHGSRGLYLRQQGLYSSQVQIWRKSMKTTDSSKQKIDYKAEYERQSKELEKAQKKIVKLEGLVDLQKKIFQILDEAKESKTE